MTLKEYIDPIDHMYNYFKDRKEWYESPWRFASDDGFAGYKVVKNGLKFYSWYRIYHRNEWLRKKT
jgi:hypothetical protein